MMKYLLPLFVCLVIGNASMAQKKADTTITYFKFDGDIPMTTKSLAGADFFRVLIPSGNHDHLYDVKEYYPNGAIKFIGQAYPEPDYFDPKIGPLFLRYDGECISYLPSGKRQVITHYKRGMKLGMEYFFYPNGKIYSSLKYHDSGNSYREKGLKWECYDNQGNQICNEGNGRWILYNSNYIDTIMEGPVSKGYFEGDWHGRAVFPDSVKLLYKYHKGIISSSTSYDRQGNARVFTAEYEKAEYKNKVVSFIERLQKKVKLPVDVNKEQLLRDTSLRVSFIIEKTGRLSDFKISGDVNPGVREAVSVALNQMDGWIPGRCYGIPYRTEISFPLSAVPKPDPGKNSGYVMYHERPIKDSN